jgi:hypothetical protein
MFFLKLSEALSILIEFLNADDQGLSKETLSNFDKYKDLKKMIKCGHTETSRLITLYYQEMIELQSSLKSSEYGKLYCRIYYYQKDERLCVDSK